MKHGDKKIALMAWEGRRAANRDREHVDNSSLPAGSPMFFTCPACYGPIILFEGFFTKPKLCYDCRDLSDQGWIFEMPPSGTGWNSR